MQTELIVTIVPRADGADVIWRAHGKIRGAVPMKDRARAEQLKAMIDRGIAPVDAVFRVFRPRRRPQIGETPEASSKYGKAGAAKRHAQMSPERRREVARLAAQTRWGLAKKPKRDEAGDQ
jgi:hypothetical protein